MVHGSLMSGQQAFAAQRKLRTNYSLQMPDRRGYASEEEGLSECLNLDAADIVERINGGAHLVGASVGGIVAMLAAIQCPQAVRSLVVIEPPVLSIALDNLSVSVLQSRLIEHFQRANVLTERAFAKGFYDALSSETELPRSTPANDRAMRRLKFERPWDIELNLNKLRELSCRKYVVSGGWHPALNVVCGRLAEKIGALESVIEGCGHAVQYTGRPFNDLLLSIWASEK